MDDRMKTHGDFGWCELMTDDVDSAIAFYTKVIGWEVETVDVGMGPYHVLKTQSQPVAGIMAKPAEAGAAPNAWTSYITVDDVDKRVAAVRSAGGQVFMGPMDVPSVGRFATISDPTGGVIGINVPGQRRKNTSYSWPYSRPNAS